MLDPKKIDNLISLKKLVDEGALTDEEFKLAKAKLIKTATTRASSQKRILKITAGILALVSIGTGFAPIKECVEELVNGRPFAYLLSSGYGVFAIACVLFAIVMLTVASMDCSDD